MRKSALYNAESNLKHAKIPSFTRLFLVENTLPNCYRKNVRTEKDRRSTKGPMIIIRDDLKEKLPSRYKGQNGKIGHDG